MPVSPYRTDFFQEQKDFYQFLLSGKQLSLEKQHPQLISFSLTVDSIFPLAVLQSMKQPNQLHFYFEKQDLSSGAEPGMAIAAIGAAAQLKLQGQNRFQQAQDWIQHCLRNTLVSGETKLPFAGPHFFCSFSFFEQSASTRSHFPDGTIFLPRWQIACQKYTTVLVINVLVDADSNLEQLAEEVWQEFQFIRQPKHSLAHLRTTSRNLFRKQFVADDWNFKSNVAKALEAIQLQQLHKIVLAHAVDVVSPIAFDLIGSLNNLRRLYPDCYIFSLSNGQGQYFIGASPERLVSLHSHQLETDALAGSAPRGKTIGEDVQLAQSLLDDEKERREHQAVIDFITHQLRQLGCLPQVAPAKVLRLSNIQHLHTLIQTPVPPHLTLMQILSRLHPTPAVAGTPREIACSQIQGCESFDRSLYAAPLGWLNQQGEGEFIVGIRSALLNGRKARLFAGAGIVSGSDPEREFAEVQLKLQALLAALV